MKKITISILLAALVAVICPAAATAGPDLYSGDTRIYGGSPVVLQPNVLIIIDNSGSMDETVAIGGGPYNNATTYDPVYNCQNSVGLAGTSCDTTTVFDSSYSYLSSPVTSLPSCTYTVDTSYYTNSTHYAGSTHDNTFINYASLMQQYGVITQPELNFTGGVASCCYKSISVCTDFWTSNGSGHRRGDCKAHASYSNGECSNATYNEGNYINWIYDSSNRDVKKIDIATVVMSNLVQSTGGVRFGLMEYYYTSTYYGSSSSAQGATFLNSVPTATIAVPYTSTIQTMDDIFTGAYTNRQALADTIQTLTKKGYTPLGESLFEAMRYYQGGSPAFGATIGETVETGGTGTTYVSPIQYGCQKNYVIFVTDGMATADNNSALDLITTTYGAGKYDGGLCTGYGNPLYTDCDGTTRQHSLAGVAKYLYEHDMRSDISGTQNVTTYTVGFGDVGGDAEAYSLLRLAADNNHGRGAYYGATNAQQLAQALTSIMGEIFSVNTSFVAPVVPVSPENKTYAGSRVYMGFFKPELSAVWSGNLKKFGLDASGNVVDSSGTYANFIDNDVSGDPGYGYDDRDGVALPAGTANGAFRPTAKSYWSTSPDGGEVQEGGVGALLLTRDLSISAVDGNMAGTKPRKIYTYLGSNTDLTNSANAFSTLNAGITAAVLGLPGTVIPSISGSTTDVKTLINFISGFDTYDNNLNGVYTEKRDWMLGDILHSKPYVMNYAVYDYVVSAETETTCSANKTVIYAGSDDGMLHAFNDCDGSEAWAFIPPELLPNLQYLQGKAHPYFLDSTVSSYIYQKNPLATSITAAAGDKVVLVIGLRRGGGLDNEPTTGSYYALDVTDPATPKFLWSNSNTTKRRGTTTTSTTDFGDMGETWSEPKIVKLKVGTAQKIAVVVGGGYDNCNEDARFGATQTFSGACVGSVTTDDSGYDTDGAPVTSGGGTAVTSLNATQYKGRALYIMELASMASGTNVPSFANSGDKIWGYNLTNTPALVSAMASEVTAIDTNFDGFADRLYMGDTGGNLWRFSIGDTNTANWTVKQIFSSNPGYTNGAADSSTGRKIFYKPSVVVDSGGMVRIYFGTGDREHPLNLAVADRMYEVIDKGQTSAVTEAKLVDVTEDVLQATTVLTDSAFLTQQANVAKANDKDNTDYYGWYIRLDQNVGEKVVAGATAYKKVVYYSTYAPNTTTESADPCSAGNLGTARIYAVDYLNGNAILNYDPTNDSLYTTYRSNSYTTADSKATTGQVLLRSDRSAILGGGIPSGIVVDGPIVLIGCGGGLCETSTAEGGQILPVYWRQK